MSVTKTETLSGGTSLSSSESPGKLNMQQISQNLQVLQMFKNISKESITPAIQNILNKYCQQLLLQLQNVDKPAPSPAPPKQEIKIKEEPKPPKKTKKENTKTKKGSPFLTRHVSTPVYHPPPIKRICTPDWVQTNSQTSQKIDNSRRELPKVSAEISECEHGLSLMIFPEDPSFSNRHRYIELFESRILQGENELLHPANAGELSLNIAGVVMSSEESKKASNYKLFLFKQKAPSFWPKRVWDLSPMGAGDTHDLTKQIEESMPKLVPSIIPKKAFRPKRSQSAMIIDARLLHLPEKRCDTDSELDETECDDLL